MCECGSYWIHEFFLAEENRGGTSPSPSLNPSRRKVVEDWVFEAAQRVGRWASSEFEGQRVLSLIRRVDVVTREDGAFVSPKNEHRREIDRERVQESTAELKQAGRVDRQRGRGLTEQDKASTPTRRSWNA